MTESIGAVASPHFLASEAAAQVLRTGGNAIDAALTAAAVLAVVYPHQCTAAGDAIAMVARADEPPIVVNGSGRAPRKLADALSTATQMPTIGPHTVTVPGALAAWEILASDWGRRPLASALRIAAHIADDGVAVSPSLARDLHTGANILAADPGTRGLFFADGHVLAEGALLRQPALARSLTQLADNGIDEFYRGELGANVVRFLHELGGTLTVDDLAAFAVETTTAMSVEFAGDEYFASSGNTQGGYFLAALAALDQLIMELGAIPDPLGIEAATIARVLQECCRQRDNNLGDLGSDAQVEHLLTRDEAAAVARRALNPKAATSHGVNLAIPHPCRRSGDTVAIVAADAEGTWVTIIQSAYYAFGAGIADPTTGFILHNRGAAFSLEHAAPNALLPGLRPPHTLMPVLVARAGRMIGAHGTMGGRVQPQVQAQLALHTARGDDATSAITRPRWIIGRMEHGPGLPDSDNDISAEDGVAAAALRSLSPAGFTVHKLPKRSDEVGHAQIVRREGEHTLCAATDPRADGAALVIS